MSEEPEDFERVFNDCYEPVVRYVARRVAADSVQDVVSETFLVAWRRREQRRGAPLPWLLGIARRVAATHRRGHARREALQERLRGERAPADPGWQIAAGDPDLAHALARLGERDREALLLTAWDGLDHRAAAQVMGCTTGSLTVRLHRARRRLARALSDSGSAAPGLTEQTGSTL